MDSEELCFWPYDLVAFCNSFGKIQCIDSKVKASRDSFMQEYPFFKTEPALSQINSFEFGLISGVFAMEIGRHFLHLIEKHQFEHWKSWSHQKVPSNDFTLCPISTLIFFLIGFEFNDIAVKLKGYDCWTFQAMENSESPSMWTCVDFRDILPLIIFIRNRFVQDISNS